MKTPWVVCQIGAREHYAVARGLAARGRLETLVTDAWITSSPFAHFVPGLSGRYHRDVPTEAVRDFTLPAILRDGLHRLSRLDSTTINIRRNAWFQARAVVELAALARKCHGERIVFAYSYAALSILHWGKVNGWRTVLGQIDPGPLEARIVAELVAKHDPGGRNEVKKPSKYWDDWRAETALADVVVVNSTWSREALVAEGVAPDKIVIVPLAYEATQPAGAIPSRSAGPLRALFLGQAILRKGIVELIDAADLLADEPIEIHVVGAASEGIARRLKGSQNLTWHGPQARSRVDAFYQSSDVFVFPTHSDGFGLTQFEAIANGLPVIAPKRCGDVVEDGVNGIVLGEVSGAAIANILIGLARDRSRVAALKQGAQRTTIPRPVDVADILVGSIT